MKKALLITSLLFILSSISAMGQAPGYDYENLALQPMPPPVMSYPPTSWTPGTTGGPAFATGWGLTIVPYGKLGYQRLYYKANVPILPSRPALYDMHGLNLAMEDTNFFAGSIGFEGHFASGLGGFFHLGAQLPRDISIETDLSGSFAQEIDDPVNPTGWHVSPIDWTGENLNSWFIDGGVNYYALPWLQIMAGFRAEHVDVSLRDPENADGAVPNVPPWWQASGIPLDITGEMVFGELTTKLWIPYMGVGARTVNYKWNLKVSPVLVTSTDVPFVLGTDWLIPLPPPVGDLAFSDLGANNYTIDLTGGFSIAGDFEYGYSLSPGIIVGGWVEARYLHIQGTGEMSATNVEDFAYLGGSGNASASGSFITKASFSTGLALNAVF
jgi:hypothetical protein